MRVEDPHTRRLRNKNPYLELCSPEFAGRRSVDLSAENLAGYDAVLIATDHSDVDWAHVVAHTRLVVDTRNVCGAIPSDKVFRA